MSVNIKTNWPSNLKFGNNIIHTPFHKINDRFQSENERLKTFESWPLEWLDKTKLAMTGMFYTGKDDQTKCCFCSVVIGKWEYHDDPLQEHLRFSPNCPLLQRRITSNVPLNALLLEAVLPQAKHSYYRLNDEPPALFNKRPCPDYSIEEERLRSFAEWPRSMKQKPKQLAEAGFYYSGKGDRVRCFSCDYGLKDWEEDDDPWEQHALWMGHCAYLKLNKGEAFIRSVVSKFKNASPEDEDLRNKDNNLEKNSELNRLTTQTIEQASSLELPDSKLCKICFDNECNTAYSPCGHVVSCARCAYSVRECPVCRKTITSVVRLYFS